VDLDEILHGGYDIEGDVYHSIMANVKLLRWVQLLNRLVDLHAILYVDYDTEGDLEAIFLSCTFNHSKMLHVENSEVTVCNTFTISSCSTVGCSEQT
jgi:hypothetical protein